MKIKPQSFLLFQILIGLCTPDAGAQSFWKKLGNPVAPGALNSSLLSSNRQGKIFVATYNMGIFQSPDQGLTWENILPLPKDRPVFVLHETSDGTILGGGIHQIYLNIPGNKNWDILPVEIQEIRHFDEDLQGNFYLCTTDSGGIFKSSDKGLTWQANMDGLPSGYVNNIFNDRKGNLFCTITDENYGGLYYLHPTDNHWVKKNMTISLDQSDYLLKSPIIYSFAISPDDSVCLSLDGVAANFLVSGIFKNSLSGLINESVWKQEMQNDSRNVPLNFKPDRIFASQNGHLFALRNYAMMIRMKYNKKWTFGDSGLNKTWLNGSMSEMADGTVIFTPDYSDQLYYTAESIPGKEVQKITFDPLPPMHLFDTSNLQASASSGREVKFTSMNPDKAMITENRLRATGLGQVTIRAYTGGDSTFYYSEEMQSLQIDKAKNTIFLEPVPDQKEGAPAVLVNATSSSGEQVKFEIIHGNAGFEGNLLWFNNAGRVIFVATEPGNGSYEAANPVSGDFCIHPEKPVITMESASNGTIILKSSRPYGNQWLLNHKPTGDTTSTIAPPLPGIYSLQINLEGCRSDESFPLTVEATSVPIPSNHQEFTIFPQPFHHEVTILHDFPTSQNWRLLITDIQGKIIAVHDPVKNHDIISTAFFPAGMYLFHLTNGKENVRIKMIKTE